MRIAMRNTFYGWLHNPQQIYSLDWFIGKFTGTPTFIGENHGSGSDFPLNQSNVYMEVS